MGSLSWKNKLRWLFNNLFVIILFSVILSAVINTGTQFQNGIFYFLGDAEHNEYNYSFNNFPNFFEFINSTFTDNLLLCFFIVLPCFFVKKLKNVLLVSIMTSFVFTTVKDAIGIYFFMSGEGSTIFECIFSNAIGSPVIGLIVTLIFHIKKILFEMNLNLILNKFIFFIASVFIYFLLMFFCYLFVLFFYKPMPVNFSFEYKADFKGFFYDITKGEGEGEISVDVSSGKGSQIGFAGMYKDISLIQGDNEGLNIQVAFFANCIKKEPQDFPEEDFYTFENVKSFSYDNEDKDAISLVYFSNKFSSNTVNIRNVSKLGLFSNKKNVSLMPSGESSKISYPINSLNTELVVITPSFISDKEKKSDFLNKKIIINVNGVLYEYTFNLTRMKLLDASKRVKCSWVKKSKIENGNVELNPNISLGMAVRINKDKNDYYYYLSKDESYIELNGFEGDLRGYKSNDNDDNDDNDGSTIEYKVINNKIDVVDIYGVTNLIVDGKVLELKNDSYMRVFGKDINWHVKKDNIVAVYGKTSNIYLNNKRLTETLWEKLDILSITIISVISMLFPVFIYMMKYALSLIKRNEEL